MNTRKMFITAAVIASALVLSCGEKEDMVTLFQKGGIAGTVDLTDAEPVTGPVFVMMTNTDNFDAIQNFPMETVLATTTAGPGGGFFIPLEETGVFPGQSVYIVAFADNDYLGGVPQPTEGDFLGIYMNRSRWKMEYVVGGDNDALNIKVNREVFSYDASVRGTIHETAPGTMTLAAYAGEITSMDMTRIDFDGVIGFKRFRKGGGPVDYAMKIFPYGEDVPVEGVYVLGFLDKNDNGIPDGGDTVSWYTDSDKGIPARITVNEGTLDGISLTGGFTVPEPGGYDMTLEGHFTAPAEYGADSPPVFLIVAEGNDPNLLFSDPVSVIREFRKLGPGETSFSLDLSRTPLCPGDEIMVIALWDKDFDGGFPDPTPGDMAGFYQDTDPDNMEFTLTLAEGTNRAEPAGTREFAVNRILYDFETTIEFTIDIADPDGANLDINPGDPLMFVAVHEDGVNLLGQITDVNYVMGMQTGAYGESGGVYRFNTFNAVYDVITDPAEMNVYIIALYDRDVDGKPTDGVDDVLAYYEKYTVIFWDFYIPDTWLLRNGELNILDKAVKNLGKKYGDVLI